MFDALIRLLALPLTWFYNLTGNYVIALVMYSILIKIALFPFGIKQQKGMVKQAKMRPKEMAIRKRYAGRTDQKTQMKLQEDLQKLYQEEGYNPLSGCGPMLIQLPIIMVLWRIIYEPLKFIMGMSQDLCNKIAEVAGGQANNQIMFLETIKEKFGDFASIVIGEGDSAEKFSSFFADADAYEKFFESFKLFGIDLIRVPNNALEAIKGGTVENWAEVIILLAIPVLVFLSQWLSTKIIRKFSYQPVQDAQAASSMKIMEFVMPLMTLFFAFNLSGLLGIYWIINSILSMVQQIVLKKLYPTPVFTEEDYKAAEKAMNGKLKPAKKASSGEKKKNPRSLHHIDDDDDEEETPAPAPKKDKPKANPLIEPAKVKDDNEDKDENDKEGN